MKSLLTILFLLASVVCFAQSPRYFFSRPTPGGTSGYFNITLSDLPAFNDGNGTTWSTLNHSTDWGGSLVADVAILGGGNRNITFGQFGNFLNNFTLGAVGTIDFRGNASGRFRINTSGQIILEPGGDGGDPGEFLQTDGDGISTWGPIGALPYISSSGLTTLGPNSVWADLSTTDNKSIRFNYYAPDYNDSSSLWIGRDDIFTSTKAALRNTASDGTVSEVSAGGGFAGMTSENGAMTSTINVLQNAITLSTTGDINYVGDSHTFSGPLPSPALTGTPTAPTAAALTSTTQIATTEFVRAGIPFVTPEDYGAAGDGSTNDATAIQNAVNSGKAVFFGQKNYRVNSGITVPTGTMIYGSGHASIISTTSNITILTLSARAHIENITLLGNVTGAAQRGIDIIGPSDWSADKASNKLVNVSLFNLNQYGLYVQFVTGVSSTTHTGSVYALNLFASGCGTGVMLDTRAEYNTFANYVAYACTTGLNVVGGNNSFTGGGLVDGTTGLILGSGSNDSKNTFVGMKVNHNTTNITASSTSNFNVFSGCHVHVGNISLVSSGNVSFDGCNITATTVTITNTVTTFSDTQFNSTTPTFTVTGTNPVFTNCNFVGTLPSTATLFSTGSAAIAGAGLSFANDILDIRRSSSATTTPQGPMRITAVSTGDMGDGFGSGFNMYIRDNAGVDNQVGFIVTARDGADNSGKTSFYTNNAGSLTAKMNISATGNVAIGQTTTTGSDLLHVNGTIRTGGNATAAGLLKIMEDTDNGTNFSAFTVGTQSGDITYTLPTALPSVTSALTTTSGGTMGTLALAQGTYTPTLSNTTNVAASTAYVTGYHRVGNSVTVYGKVDIDVTLAASAATELGISLPVASNFAAEEDAGGSAVSDSIASLSARIKADATNDRVSIVFKAISLTNDSYNFEFSYQVK